MAKVVSPSLVVVVVVVVVVLSLGGAPRPTQASDCNAADDIVVNAGQTQVIKTMDNVGYGGELTAYVKPEREFEGVHLEVLRWYGTPHIAWFPREECFKYYDEWQMFILSVVINTGGIHLGYRIGTCWRRCVINKGARSLSGFILVAHGSSRWRNETPLRDCLRSTNGKMSPPSPVPTCQFLSSTTTHSNGGNRNPQTTTTTRTTTTTPKPITTSMAHTTTPTTTKTTTTTPTTTTTTTPMILSVVAIVGLVGLLVAFVVRKVVSVVCPKQQQQQQVTSNEVRFHPQPGHAHPGHAQPYHAHPGHAHPGHAHPQLTTTQGHTPAQDEDNIYYEILPGNIHRRVVFGQPPTHRDTHKEEEGGGGGEGGTHPARPDSPLYDDVLPNDDYGATEDSHSHIYATVL